MMTTDEPPRRLVSRVRPEILGLPPTTSGLVAAGLALLLPLLTVRLAAAPAWTPRYALLGLEAAIGIPVLVALLRTSARRAAAVALASGIVAAVSTLVSDNPAMSFFGMDFWGTGCLFLLGLIGIWAIGVASGRAATRAIEQAITAGVVINTLVAVVQLFTDLSRFGAPGYRNQPTGLLGQPVALGELLLGGLWLVLRRPPRVEAKTLMLVGFVGLGIEIAGERLPLVLVPLVVGAAVWRRPRGDKLMLAVAVAVGVILGVGLTHVGTAADSNSATDRLQGGVGQTARFENYVAGLHAFADRPVLGWGPGRYQAAASQYRTRSLASAVPDSEFTDAHDLPLQYAVTMGLAGLGAFGLWLWLVVRRASGPLVGFALLVLAVQLLQPQDITLTPLALLALGAAGPLDAVRRVVVWPLQAVLVAGGVVFAGIVMLGGYHDRQADRGSLSDALAAARMYPHWPDRAIEAANAELSNTDAPLAERLSAATSWTAIAVARDRRDVRSAITQGFVDLIVGDSTSAGLHLDEGLRLDPYSPEALAGKGIVAQRNGDLAGAIQWYKRAVAISPNHALAGDLLRAAQSAQAASG